MVIEKICAFHSIKISENSGSISNGTENFSETHFENFGNLWKLSFFPEIWQFRKVSVPFYISSRHDACLVPVAVSVASAKGKGVGVDISN